MNKAKKIYLDKNGNMCRIKPSYGKMQETEPFVLKGKLRLVNVGWQNSGMYFIFKAEDGRIYYMSNCEFIKYIENHKVMIDGAFEFLQQGTVYSLGEIGDYSEE